MIPEAEAHWLGFPKGIGRRKVTSFLSNYRLIIAVTASRCLIVLRTCNYNLFISFYVFVFLFLHVEKTKNDMKFNQTGWLTHIEPLNFFHFFSAENINFLTADGVKFAHPLHHLGKSVTDLPLIAIDSFRHMYLFPDAGQMEVTGKLKTFLMDLYSGKLHREFHNRPELPVIDHRIASSEPDKVIKAPTTPPESTFRKLAPSKNRYTLLKDEL